MEIISITQAPENAGSHSCRCGEESSSKFPELDATLIPHEIRHPVHSLSAPVGYLFRPSIVYRTRDGRGVAGNRKARPGWERIKY